MPLDRSLAALMDFLTQSAESGVLNLNTAASRKASVQRMASAMNEKEIADVTELNVDDVARRFFARSGHPYSIASQISYKSRLQSSIDEFRAWLDDPNASSTAALRPRMSLLEKMARPARIGEVAVAMNAFPIAIRSDTIVQIVGLPFDLSRAEAQKIANIILAHAEQ